MKALEQAKLFLASRENENLLSEILQSFCTDEGPDLLESVKCFQLIFTEIFKRGDFNYGASAVGSQDRKYSQWLRGRYIKGTEDLAKIVQTNDSPKLREIGIDILVSFHGLEQEYEAKFHKSDHSLIISLIEAFLDPDSRLINSASTLTEYLKPYEFRMEFMNCLHNTVEVCSKCSTPPREKWIRNLLKLIKVLVKSASGIEGLGDEVKASQNKCFNKKLSKIWMFVMDWRNMSTNVLRQVVTMLVAGVLERFNRPLLLQDLFAESFRIGGVLSVVSLRGTFLLKVKYDIECPDVYTKLYSLFELSVLASDYCEQFLRCSANFLALTSLCQLSSTVTLYRVLPEYVVAAFVKKLSRMSLHAPAPSFSIPLICQFIVNLMIQHPGLKVLIDNTNMEKAKDLESDPFDDRLLDFKQMKAIESSLWEIKYLQNHHLPDVAYACSFIGKPLPAVAYDLGEELSSEDDNDECVSSSQPPLISLNMCSSSKTRHKKVASIGMMEQASGVTIPPKKYPIKATGVPIPPIQYPSKEYSVRVPGPGGDHKGWIKMAPEAMTQSIKAPEAEKKIMELWNQHAVKNMYLGDCQILKACEDFVENLAFGKSFDEELYTAALIHFAGLFDHGLLTGKEFSHVTNKMLSYKGITVKDGD